jgi:hypothetical protein
MRERVFIETADQSHGENKKIGSDFFLLKNKNNDKIK